MNILFVTFAELSLGNGTRRSISILRALADAGHSVDVLAAKYGIAEHPNIQILENGSDRILPRRMLRRFFAKAMRRKTYNLIHCVDEAALLAARRLRWRKVKIVYEASRCFSGPNGVVPAWYWKPFPTYLQRLERNMLRRADMVLSGCGVLSADIRKLDETANVLQIESIPAHPLLPRQDVEKRKFLARFEGKTSGIVVCCVRQGNESELRTLMLATRKVLEVLPHTGFFFHGLATDKADPIARNLDIHNRCVFLDRQETEVYLAVLEIADAVLFMPEPGGRYVDPEVITLLLAPSPLVAVQDSAHAGTLSGQNSIQVLSTAESISDGLLRVFQEPLLALALAIEGQQMVADHHSFSSFKHKIRMAYHEM